MSFVTQDKDLIKALLKIANNKYAQAQTPPPDPIKNNQIITGLVNKLKNNLDNYTEGDFVSTRDNAQLNLVNLQSGYQFLLFLQQNGIMYNNQPLSIVHMPNLGPDRQKEQHYNILLGRGLNKNDYVKYPKPKDGPGDDFRFWINKEGITEFLRSLYNRSKDQGSGGNLLKVLVDKLLVDINTKSGQTINPNSKPVPRLPETTPIDRFPNPYNLSDPFKQGNVILTLKDINNQSNFESWLARLPVTENGVELAGPANKKNICKVLEPISNRAENYIKYFGSEQDSPEKQKYDFYFSQIESFMSANNCNVNTNVPATTEKPEKGTGTDGNKESGDRKRTQTVMSDQNLDALVRRLPLNMNTINFVYIKNFFRYLVGYTENAEDKSRFQRYENVVNSYIGQYQQLLSVENTETFNLRTSPREFQAKLQNASNYAGALEYLALVVSNTRDAIADLKTNLEGNVSDYVMSSLESQVGSSGTSGNSIASQNLQIISRLESEVSQVIRRTKGK